jgi:hypothetical protein
MTALTRRAHVVQSTDSAVEQVVPLVAYASDSTNGKCQWISMLVCSELVAQGRGTRQHPGRNLDSNGMGCLS